MTIKTLQENIEDFVNEVQSAAPELSDTTEGSTLDTLAGAVAFLASEASRVILDEFAKTFFDSANGPEVTGGPDYLQTLAVDHFGDGFARPTSVKASGTVTFSRPNTNAGNVTIPAGTVVKTRKNSDGEEFSFATIAAATLTGTSLAVAVQATAGGSDWNVGASSITILESALTDATVAVTNASPFTGGADALSDADYREYIRQKLASYRLSVLFSIEAAAKTVSGITYATGLEKYLPTIEYDYATSAPKVGAVPFRIPVCSLYVAGAGGSATAEQIGLVETAISSVRSFGVGINVYSATTAVLDWTVTVVLNSNGPNYAAFLGGDFSLVEDSMRQYLAELAIGAGFDKVAATSTIEAIWGSAGTDDLLSISTTTPGASIAAVEGRKFVPGTIGVA